MKGKTSNNKADPMDDDWEWYVPVKRANGRNALSYQVIRYRHDETANHVTVWAQRLDSLSNLFFEFRGFKLHKRTPRFPRARAYKPRFRRLKEVDDDELKVIVNFGAQHFAETIPSRHCYGGEDCRDPDHCRRFVGEYADYYGPLCGNPPAAEHISLTPSGSTRLVFRISDEFLNNKKLRFKLLEQVFSQQLLVDSRADEKNRLSVRDQLKVPFGEDIDERNCGDDCDSGQIYDQALEKIAATLHRIESDATSLEVVSSLHMSPSQEVGWEFGASPSSFPNEFSRPLWTVRLDSRGRKTVRALYSDFIASPRLEEPKDELIDGLPALERYFEEGHALSRKDHMDLIAQTSLYGMPAIRAIADDSDDENSTKTRGPLNRADVQLPEPPPKYVSCLNQARGAINDGLEDVGIAFARPMDDADISLSALGATFTGEFNADPFNYVGRPKDAGGTSTPPITLSLEKMRYMTWLSRDWVIEAVFKGYLFPLGLRASLVTLVRRAIMPFRAHQDDPIPADSQDGASFLERRQFIVVKNGPKLYPGPYHPFEARDFPPDRIRMKTLVTPFLMMDKNTLSLNGTRVHAFWPMVLTEPDEPETPFVFEWETDDVTSIQGELLFVLNDSIQRPAHLHLLCKYYEGDIGSSPDRPASTKVVLAGGRHRYAPATSEGYGKTSFDTHSWKLGVRGRTGRPSDETAFELDGRMVAADQPPFYPYMKHAEINVQAIDHVMRRSQGYVKAYYFDAYAASGFEGDNAAGEIFLTIDPDALQFDAVSNSERLGGFASPSGVPVALSRKSGVINGRSVPGAPKNSSARFPAAAEGIFQPDQFFSAQAATSTLSGSKSGIELFNVDILELVAGGDIDEDAPKLQQSNEFSLNLNDAQSKRILAAIVRRTVKFLYGTDGVIGDIEGLITDPEQFATYYGKLYDSMQPFLGNDQNGLGNTPVVKTLLNEVLDYATGDEASEDALRAASELLNISQTLLDEIDNFIREPVPDNVRRIVETFESLFAGSFERSARRLFFEYLQTSPAPGVLNDWINDIFCPILDGDLAEVLLGGSARSCQDYINHPDLLLADLERGLAGPLLTTFENGTASYLSELREATSGTLLGAREEFVTLCEEWIALATELVVDLLKPCEQEADNILCADIQKALAEDVTDAVFEAPVNGKHVAIDANLSVDSLHDALANLKSALEQTPERVAETLRAYGDKIHLKEDLPQPPSEEEVLNRLTAAIVREVYPKVALTLSSLSRLIETWRDVSWVDIATLVSEFAVERAEQLLKLHDIVRLPQFPTEWCAAATSHLREFADGMMADDAVLQGHVDTIIDEVQQLQVDTSKPAELRDAFSWLERAAHNLKSLMNDLQVARTDFTRLTGDVCTGSGEEYGKLSARVLRIRGIAYEALTVIIRTAKAIADPESHGAFNTTAFSVTSDLSGVTNALNELLFDLSALSRSGDQSLDKFRQAISSFRELNVPPGLRGNIETVGAYLENKVDDLQSELTIVNGDITKLERLVDEFEIYIAHAEQGFLALLSSSFVFPESLKADIETASAKGLRPIADIVSRGPYGFLSLLFDPMDYALANPKTLDLSRAVFGDQFVDKVTRSFDDLYSRFEEERDLLSGIINTNDVDTNAEFIIDSAREFSRRIRSGEFHFVSVERILGDTQTLDLQQRVTETLRGHLTAARESLEQLASEILPTSFKTSYDWKTTLDAAGGQFPLIFSEDAYLDSQKYGGDYHLVLAASFSADPFTGETKSVVEGHLSEFDLKLFPNIADVATITFEESYFTSVNGAKPDLRLDVKQVEIGNALEYLHALQEWLAPEGNGFYLEPIFYTEPGIEAGYEFTADLIQFGPLQFIDLGFGIAARLYFRGRPAEFEFRLARESRPFLIAAPPYGGGGWLKLVAQGDDIQHVGMSFVYGGVTRIKFGPLKADGRILVGGFLRSNKVDGKTRCTGGAIFEASGEGKIACFSISVCLLVVLSQRNNGDLEGKATFSFKFKMGIVKYRYSVTAHHRAKGSNSSARRMILSREGEESGAGDLGSQMQPTYTTNLCHKETNWKEYKSRFYSLDLNRARGVLS